MAFSIQYWLNYTEDKTKLRRKSEASVAANRVLQFMYDDETNVVCAYVQASMRDKSYKVQVCVHFLVITIRIFISIPS